MHATNLRKVGGSVMLSIPPAILEQLHLRVGSTVTISLDGEKLIIESSLRPHYTCLFSLLNRARATSMTPLSGIWCRAA
jgi:antitoxin ChpS